MIAAWNATRNYLAAVWDAWNRFWFTPTDPAVLCLIRLLAGGMLLYTHLVWTIDLDAFFAPSHGWLPTEFMRQVYGEGGPTWSVFYYLESAWARWLCHFFALGVFACLAAGLFSRPAAVMAFFLAVNYANRVTPGAYFGLDKINCMLALYLMLGPCGARYSLDRLWSLRRGARAEVVPSVAANVAIRLIQLHMCIIYLFSGLAKLEGISWRSGVAVWLSVANYEYQSLDMTWLAGWPQIVALLTYVTVFWELFYCCLIWNRYTRPPMLLIAVGVHGGIAASLGMITFGVVMLIGNLAFLTPATVRHAVDPLAARIALAVGGGPPTGSTAAAGAG